MGGPQWSRNSAGVERPMPDDGKRHKRHGAPWVEKRRRGEGGRHTVATQPLPRRACSLPCNQDPACLDSLDAARLGCPPAEGMDGLQAVPGSASLVPALPTLHPTV